MQLLISCLSPVFQLSRANQERASIDAMARACLSPVFQLSRANQERASIDAMARASIDASSEKRYRADQ
ncbi:hypothetical protein DY000_02007798 [Brassica cretica]|uniref:Uncharacterized protein n=1 Tax=Brassica cretica TaxID=69181 RepID=A0ABQ7BXZ2_BRACR|nr:hypothetical protein DY000_02007798 [Brassica cretica]